jgi:hypothetical protein
MKPPHETADETAVQGTGGKNLKHQIYRAQTAKTQKHQRIPLGEFQTAETPQIRQEHSRRHRW